MTYSPVDVWRLNFTLPHIISRTIYEIAPLFLGCKLLRLVLFFVLHTPKVLLKVLNSEPIESIATQAFYPNDKWIFDTFGEIFHTRNMIGLSFQFIILYSIVLSLLNSRGVFLHIRKPMFMLTGMFIAWAIETYSELTPSVEVYYLSAVLLIVMVCVTTYHMAKVELFKTLLLELCSKKIGKGEGIVCHGVYAFGWSSSIVDIRDKVTHLENYLGDRMKEKNATVLCSLEVVEHYQNGGMMVCTSFQ